MTIHLPRGGKCLTCRIRPRTRHDGILSTRSLYELSCVPFFSLGWLCCMLAISAATAVAQPVSAPATKTDAINAAAKPPAVTTRPFGVAPAGITSPELGEAVKAMDDASILPGQKNTITRLRWSDETVPKLWFAGLWGPKVDDALMAMTSHTPDLWSVELHEPHIDDEGMRSLAKLPKLRYLVVSPIERYVKPGYSPVMYCFPNFTSAPDRPRVTGKSLEAFAGSATLESLELFDAVIASTDLQFLASIPKLSSVGLPNAIDDEAVKHLQSCKRLSNLSLGYREITADEIERLAGWKTLRRLAITHATLSDAALEALAKLPSVDTLELIDCGLTDERLAHLRLPPKTVTLLLGRNEIAGPGLVHLAGGNLKTLGLEYNNLDDDTIRHLPQLRTLKKLFLEYCEKLTDAGIRTGVLQGMTHLEELRLRGMKKVTDASLDDLVKFGHLKTISVRSVGITNDGVERMKKGMPETHVFR